MQDLNQEKIFTCEPIFLVGAERSGTTLLRLQLNSHPKVFWINEFEYVVDKIGNDGNYPNLNDYYDWLETHRIFRMSSYTLDRSLSYPELVNSFLSQRQASENKPIVGATVHRNFDKILLIWPKARFIHIVRDPRGVSPSCVAMGWAGDVWHGVERWIEAEKLWANFKTKVSHHRRIDVTYEELITDNHKVLLDICHFIGIEYTEKFYDYVKNTDYKIPDPKLLRTWKSKLTDYDIQLIESRCKLEMLDLGYELSELPSINPSKKYLEYLSLINWWTVFRFRIKRYGFVLILARSIARRAKMKKLHRYLLLKSNDLRMKTIKKSW